MSCNKCGRNKCTCTKKVINQYGPAGKQGVPGAAAQAVSVTVKDNTTTVSNVKEVRFTDANAKVTNLGGGIVQVNFTPPATVWKNILNIEWYSGSGVDSFRPQYAIEGNKITFRGLLFLPLQYDLAAQLLTSGSSYQTLPSSLLDETSVLPISNANNNNGTPQGRVMTKNVSTKKNLLNGDIPQGRDIQFANVPCYRRYSNGSQVTVYRSFVNIRIASTATPYLVSSVAPTGCILVFSPWNDEYDGSGNPPLGNDPLALSISRATAGHNASDYVGNLDNYPWVVGDAGVSSPFDCNGHHITSLGGFIINLEGLSGYLN